ncbi:hypothetical protein P153DRAFT_199821 [Dothidotthia symphoricarpi CBS 119687]|uniref:Uncharacterized protein n=1 Tax=Dothidotthia symphoricarpi CBS 119687 TaxID=1392245 RepID=A0A6A6AI11_9PLEO|nr:uncharacterized protein P153DRAFT_199821 [Dothidotthia symphoricarpi CBS 119687]KAF2131622.1 hypothetical protein P153DRAFT_199821 [Dothidotthia symphoricarpi CBS 119687]
MYRMSIEGPFYTFILSLCAHTCISMLLMYTTTAGAEWQATPGNSRTGGLISSNALVAIYVLKSDMLQ